jgi:hypothetical protein
MLKYKLWILLFTTLNVCDFGNGKELSTFNGIKYNDLNKMPKVDWDSHSPFQSKNNHDLENGDIGFVGRE